MNKSTTTIYYSLCDLCRQTCSNEHQQDMTEQYHNLFNETPIIELEQIVDKDLWNWKQITLTNVYSTIWKSEDWNNFKKLQIQIQIPIKIIQHRPNKWSRFINYYRRHEQHIQILIKTLLDKTAKPTSCLPNFNEVQMLKSLLDNSEQRNDGIINGNYCLI
ncbi:unnamed protein product, partial [Didymodactylos carnosus]